MSSQPSTQPTTHNTLENLNNMLAGRTIASVEPGKTRGWILINFLPTPEDGGCRAFMTLKVDEEQDPHYWSAAIHYRGPDGGSVKYPIYPLVESQ